MNESNDKKVVKKRVTKKTEVDKTKSPKKKIVKKDKEVKKVSLNEKEVVKNEVISSNKNDVISEEKAELKLSDSVELHAEEEKTSDDKKDGFKIEIEKSFKLIEVIIISIVMLCVGLFVGSLFLKQKDNKISNTSSKYYDEFMSIVDTIKKNAYPEVSYDDIYLAAIEGVVSGIGDKYSEYFDKTETTNFEIKMKGSYVGIGCEIATLLDGSGIVVLAIYEDSPASKAGLMYGDIIVEVDGVDSTGWSSDYLSNYIRTNGAAGTTVTLKVKRNDDIVTLNLKRELVVLKSVSGKVIEKNNKKVGYIKIDLFASNTYEQFINVLRDLEKQNIDSLVLDVRDNNGGYLNSATAIVSMFIPTSKIIYQLRSSEGLDKIHALTDEKRDYNIAVLVNENSASASEILASALKESYGATVVGRTTFGKGTVQETAKLSNGSLIKYTTQNWLTPNGTFVEGVGYTPDVIVTDDSLMVDTAVDTLLNK